MRLAPVAVAALAIFACYKLYSSREIAHAPGVLVASDPEQRDIESAAVIERGEFRLRPRAEFSATVRVLHREDYSVGALAKLVPTDFAVGWGPMSDSAVLADIEISQGNRFYFWRTDSWPIERADIEDALGQLARDSGELRGEQRARPSARRQRGNSFPVGSWTSKAGTAACELRCRAATRAPAPARYCWPSRHASRSRRQGDVKMTQM